MHVRRSPLQKRASWTTKAAFLQCLIFHITAAENDGSAMAVLGGAKAAFEAVLGGGDGGGGDSSEDPDSES